MNLIYSKYICDIFARNWMNFLRKKTFFFEVLFEIESCA